MTDRPMHQINLTCEVCGWQVNALVAGSNGTSFERARTELAGRLRWSCDGKRCDFCKDGGAAGGRAGAPRTRTEGCPA